jgi:hypothetical protein
MVQFGWCWIEPLSRFRRRLSWYLKRPAAILSQPARLAAGGFFLAHFRGTLTLLTWENTFSKKTRLTWENAVFGF